MFNLGNADKNLLIAKNEENKYYDKKIKIDINDINNTHSIIANYVMPNTVCLDVGCGAGYTGDLLKNEKKCVVDGIDIDKAALAKAKNKNIYKNIFNFSITDKNSNEYKNFFDSPIKYDYIIFADVLEHVSDPGNLIYVFSKKLKKDGKILASVPNVAHMDICLNVINRTFNYNKIGILDNTHLRFFTKNSFLEMIAGLNDVYKTSFDARLIGKTIIDPPYIDKYPNLYNLLNEDKEFCVLQYVYEISNFSTNIKKENLYKIDYCSIIEKKLEKEKSDEKTIKRQELQISILSDKLEKAMEKNNIISQNLMNEIEENKKILKSRSWRVTEPFRRVSLLFYKTKNKLSRK